MAYKIGSNIAIGSVGISSYSLPFNLYAPGNYTNFYPDLYIQAIADNRFLSANGSHVTIGFLTFNEPNVTFAANNNTYYDIYTGSSYPSVALGDGLIVVADPHDSTLNNRSGSASVYDYNGSYKFTLFPSTNVAANIYFGHTVSTNSNLISVCSFESNIGGSNSGTIYVYYSNGTLKSKTYRPVLPQVTSTNQKGFRGVLIDGYRILATDMYSRSANTATNNAGAVYLFATDNTRIFTSNQQVDIGTDDMFGTSFCYSEGMIHVGSPLYESQVAAFPLNDGLVSGFSLQGDLVYRYDPGSGSKRGTIVTANEGYVAVNGYYASYVELLTTKGRKIRNLSIPSASIPCSDMYIHNGILYLQAWDGILTYNLEQHHNGYYNNTVKNMKRYY